MAVAPQINIGERKIIDQETRTVNIKNWVTFFRRNIHRFIEMYLGIKLYPHQRLEFYMMGISSRYGEVAARGTAKSWKAGVLAISMAILYPGSEIVIVSSSKKQASVIIEKKIRPLYDRYENVNREIDSIISNNNDCMVRFKNGSTIFVVALRESARGNRATMIIFEEFRLLDKQKIDSIISPFKHPRQAEFLKLPEYIGRKDLIEEPQEIYITSSGKDTDEFYAIIEDIMKKSVKTDDNNCIFMDYIIGLRYNMQTVQQISQERSKMDEETFRIEYENALVRENKDSFFSRSLFDNARTLKVAYYPQRQETFDTRKNPLGIPLNNGELIIISVDIALKASHRDDNTIISVDRLIPTKKGYQHNIVYQETMRGKNSIVQALRIKQIWYDFSANYIVLDANNAGTAIYDIMTEKTLDPLRGVEYPPMTSMYHKSIKLYDDYKQRTRSPMAIPIIYPMWATEAINSDMAYMTRDALNTDLLKLMCNPTDGEDFLMEDARYFDVSKDLDSLSWFMQPYYQASETQTEFMNLRPIYFGNSVKLVEPSMGRKDRYSSVAYAVWFTRIVLDPNIVKETREIKWEDTAFITPRPVKQSSSPFFGNRCGNVSNNFGRRKLFGS